ncbi:bifunctional diaminohydroxyphosphoribosylaminopyrimidine deaminase/5-amino-6-(5-phosphoribosylamino)uracil reductase RibD [Cyclobacterium jeungdonense]|uniref:Riboflavin biosynthesis protein RibD n=1 Tax=Cyclobacterium jeungdonense TaxID=708087 RepID=A0ABT8C7I4_9BACT|nr:bifunctional diaminohydroxyphosphoribosylaminopyrimidine deaminase/5-amino-6-(5-phosphoribosylamino)uracil reductase RibD [Cyclobacterium jeungdonense]MDN3687690.1 bifunctional diaminohydroxyphosphoribosylaminopyrimidine deaminase/5-amino-6-(5-phosphoribosylamino)uracil reductase RibD [Cyclobacterium jeungdonense]
MEKNRLTPAQDLLFMRRALDLASLGQGKVSPNPLVGCVIVHNGLVIGEGYHEQYGQAHAEVNAIARVNDKELLPFSTLYVTLEPCAHHGKTPPCADLVVRHQLKRVVIGAVDSNPLVGGKGITKLEKAGIRVETGILEKEIRYQNRRFFTQMEKGRPFILLKWAQTRDGFIARSNYDSKWISNPLSRQLVHRWRAEESSILVGTNTAHYDNPQLTVRDWTGKNPLRLVIDRQLRLSPSLKLFDDSQPTLIYNQKQDKITGQTQWVRLDPGFTLKSILEDLHQRNIQSLMVEGGAALLRDFIGQGLWDEARVFTGTSRFGLGIPAPMLPVYPTEQIMLDQDLLQTYTNHE